MPEFGVENLELELNNDSRTVESRGKNWTFLPYELWLIILVDYGLTSRDFAKLDRCCKWFRNPWQGML
jgi:hypothetical protein